MKELRRVQVIKFTKKLFPKFKEYLMSNFSIVNLRAWKNLPNAYTVKSESGQERGTHRVHRDGFPPGHIKCMIYLQPLDEDHGFFELDEKKIDSLSKDLTSIMKFIEKLNKSLENIIRKCIEDYIETYCNSDDLYIRRWPSIFSIQGWTVFLQKQRKQNSHNHLSGWMSGVIYLQVPKANNKKKTGIMGKTSTIGLKITYASGKRDNNKVSINNNISLKFF